MMQINGTLFVTVSEVAQAAGVTRQTLWRWRTSGLIPIGQRFKGKLIVYTREECAEIRDFANRLEKVEMSAARSR